MSDSQEFYKKADLLFQLYGDGKYLDALEVAEQTATEFPDRQARTSFWLICLQNMTGQPDKALHTFHTALDSGIWWAEAQLRSDSDLDTLQGMEEFEQLVKRSEEMHRQAEADAKPFIEVHQPAGNGPFPALVCLGPRGGYPELDFRDWSPVLDLGWMLALPRSSQMASPVSFVWDDREKAFRDVEGLFDTLLTKYPVDPYRIVLAGFSQGASRAIELVMSQRLKVRGVIAVVPGPIDVNELEGWTASGVGRFVLISGGKDPRVEMFLQVKEMFERHNIPLMFLHYPEMAHQIPGDFDAVLAEGLQFILEEDE